MRTRDLTALLLAAPLAIAAAPSAGACEGMTSKSADASIVLAQSSMQQTAPPQIPGAPPPPSLPGGGVSAFPGTPQPGTVMPPPPPPPAGSVPGRATDAAKDAAKDAVVDPALKNLPAQRKLPGQ